jgi:hypothetical protein
MCGASRKGDGVSECAQFVLDREGMIQGSDLREPR